MLTNLQIFIVTALSVGGAVFSALSGWLESGEPFEPRKFTSSMLRAFLAGVVTAGSTFAGMDTIANGWIYVFVFLAGAGIDSLANRLSGAASSRNTVTTTTSPSSTTTTTTTNAEPSVAEPDHY
jgi:hypothetical protein